MTRRVFKVGHIFKKIAKKLLWSYMTHKSTIFEHFQINLSKTVFFWSDDVIFKFFFKFFSKMRPSGHFVFMKICVAWTFLVELHLDHVLKVLMVFGFKKKSFSPDSMLAIYFIELGLICIIWPLLELAHYNSTTLKNMYKKVLVPKEIWMRNIGKIWIYTTSVSLPPTILVPSFLTPHLHDGKATKNSK